MNRLAAMLALSVVGMDARDVAALRAACDARTGARKRSRKVAVEGTGGQGGTGRRRVKRKGGR